LPEWSEKRATNDWKTISSAKLWQSIKRRVNIDTLTGVSGVHAPKPKTKTKPKPITKIQYQNPDPNPEPEDQPGGVIHPSIHPIPTAGTNSRRP